MTGRSLYIEGKANGMPFAAWSTASTEIVTAVEPFELSMPERARARVVLTRSLGAFRGEFPAASDPEELGRSFLERLPALLGARIE